MSMDGRTCVITGSARGIGRGIAKYLGEEGANVVINYRSSEEDAYEACRRHRISRAARLLQPRQTFPTARPSSTCVRSATEAFGQCDVLVNNAWHHRRQAVHRDVPRGVGPCDGRQSRWDVQLYPGILR
ncbi:SDR family NAD(P)-dependent oxidoreductase [Natrinema hispanicum]|uniref:SDR family NAD(P)-dependent oxidoreductase n=1 Tax=Natrinema hispanicum TaxID=392421 RepID=UPI0037439DB7